MLWSVKTRYDTYGRISLAIEWYKSDENYEDYLLYIK